MQGKKGSNHWILSKKTGIPYIISKESREKMSKASSGRLHTEETKRKISEKRKQYLKNNPDKVPYKLNHSSEISYPEEYFLECFKNYKNVSFQHRVNTYSLDFANVEEKLYLEVDGEQHYLDNRILKHDIKRTKKLEELGWDGIRIRWAEFKKLSNDDKKEKVETTIKFMKFSS